MHYLAGTASVHTTAAICDYLDGRATATDTVTVVAVAPPTDTTARRDAQEALNVAPVRLATVDEVTTELREDDGDPAKILLEAAAATGADELVITSAYGLTDGSTTVGSTAHTVLEGATRPVVVIPALEG
ncbi:universal stress protein [Natronorubrum thiooxidans]|uniref:Universal stress protein family protein n=1 Tax=Natronorubrum thiooxidans TaxID=308853 RepID=A0A1N7FIC4_9EURY|nr:universal stress protein [Natronorubrum thiooxidans]SIS00102.1 Universal stress protein family protein [Natronorubrum thiooxidans]